MLVLTGMLCAGVVSSQNPVTVTVLENVNFGAFAISGGGGTITVSSQGMRSATGGVVLIGNDYNAGVLQVEAPAGTYLNLITGFPSEMTGSNGGQMIMEVGDTYPAFLFNNVAAIHNFQFGATLTIVSVGETPPGTYNGNFEIIVSYE